MICLREIGRGERVQGCCYASSVHTIASNLSLDNEEHGDGAHWVSPYGMWNAGESSEVSAPDHQDWWAGEKNVWTDPRAARKDARVNLLSPTGAEGGCWQSDIPVFVFQLPPTESAQSPAFHRKCKIPGTLIHSWDLSRYCPWSLW